MNRTNNDTPVGVDDPYQYVERCDYLTDEGNCRFAVEQGDRDPQFAKERRAEDFRCPVAGAPEVPEPDGPWEWKDCPHFRCRNRERECSRCGLDEQRMAHDDERPLLEEHHLSYSDDVPEDGAPAHEITIFLCRWCHAKVHKSWARIDDDVNPVPEAVGEREQRRARQDEELGFDSAAKRYENE